jgi:uncharacterized protein
MLQPYPAIPSPQESPMTSPMTTLLPIRRWSRALTLAASLAVTLMAVAPAAAQTPEAQEAAKELMVTMRSADQFKAIMPSLMQALKPAIVQNRPEVEHDFDALVPALLGAMTSRLDEILDKVAGIYARNFTAAELKEVTAFYRGPTGQKFVQRLPSVMQESLTVGQQFGQQIAAELQKRMIEELRKKGHNI